MKVGGGGGREEGFFFPPVKKVGPGGTGTVSEPVPENFGTKVR